MANNDEDNTGDDEKKPPKKRARVTQSCNTCRKRRVKCSGNEPLCEPCAVKHLECSWTAPKRRGPVPGRNLQARSQRLCNHLYDLFQVVPGLESISEVLLGLRELQSASALPTTLQVRLPENIEEVTESMQISAKHAIFRTTLVGKHFDEDIAETGEESPVPPSATEGVFPSMPTSLTPVSVRHQQLALPPLPPTVFPAATTSNISLEDILSQINGHPTYAGNVSNVFDGPSKPAHIADLPKAPSQIQQHEAHAATAVPTEAEDEALPHRYIWGAVNAADGNIPCLFGATSGFVDAGKAIELEPTTNDADAVVHDPIGFLTPSAQIKLFDIFLNVIHPYLPMCSRLDLMRWSHEPMPALDSQRHRPLRMVIIACALPYLPPTPDVNLPRQAAALRRQARIELANEICKPTLQTLHALLLLSLADWGAGDLATAWAGLAQTIALAQYLGLQVPPTETTNLDNSAHSRLVTFYCIVVLDVALASQLGRWPLCPGVTTVLELPSNGYDEWDSWKIGSPAKLAAMYNEPAATTQGAAEEIVIPGHIHSIFSQAVSVARIGQRILTIANAIERSRNDVLALTESLQDLEEIQESLGRPTEHLSTVTQTPQHGIDVELTCLYWRIIIYRELSAIGEGSSAECSRVVQEARTLVALRMQAHTFYRSSTPCLHMLYTLASNADGPLEATPAPEVTALKQMQRIFPAYADALLNILPQGSENTYRESLGGGSQALTSLSLPFSPASMSGLASHFVAPALNGFGTAPAQDMQGSFPQRLDSIIPTYGTRPNNLITARTSPVREAQYLSQSTGAAPYTVPAYSLPDQAFAAILGDESLDRQKAFDVATWEQTDVLASLGAFNLPLDNGQSHDIFGLSGVLDRWSSGDGDLWSRTAL